jgi:hypothetical protein
LPSGFAFAREMWIEVAVETSPGSRNFRVLVGGRNGRPLQPTEPLDKKELGLHNFQAVLFNETTRREVVLQNEATTVLKGQKARDSGFGDREAAIPPGQTRPLAIDLSESVNDGRAIRVRLLFRNLPVEFIEGLADKFDAREEHANAARTRALVEHLRILEMANDTLASR